MRRFRSFGWSVLFVVVACALVGIDQLFLYSAGKTSNHVLFCRFENCSRTAFRAHPKYFFLLDPKRSEFLARLAGSPEIERHNDYKLNGNGFRVGISQPNNRKIKVNIFGDSFTFELFLRESEHIVSLLNAVSSRCSFRNYGVPAFDLRQMILLSQDHELVADSDVDLFLFISDDIPRITRPFEVHRFGRAFDVFDLSRELGIKPVLPFRISPFLVNNFFLFQRLEAIIDRRFWSSVDKGQVLARMRQLNRSGRQRKLYFHIPIPGDYARDDTAGVWKLNLPSSLADASLGEPVLYDYDSFQKLFFRGDGHPNPAGAKWIASKVMDRLRDMCRPL